MANPPNLRVSGLPSISAEEQAATTSPARGAEMLNFLQARLNQKNRAPPLVHSWAFWHDRQDRLHEPAAEPWAKKEGTYEDRLELLAHISDVKAFWNVFNNFDVARLRLRDSVHLFHKGVKPVWEDPRNEKGGCWTFRVPKDKASEFWKEVTMMAIGEQLQAAVDSDQGEKKTFRDDICGVSLSVRFNSMLVQIWNRDAEHQSGVDGILQTVLERTSPALKPREESYYYKRHNEHAGFHSGQTPKASDGATTASQEHARSLRSDSMQALDAAVKQ